MAIKPWYKIATPREDLREGKPLDAAEFAVHLDQVRDGRAPSDYQKPDQFFERTYLTNNLMGLAAEVVRRLSGEKTETSAVFNMATQFGGGKTHALTLLYHLARNGAKANRWQGVSAILDKAKVSSAPEAATAVFVGTEFDSLTGRGGNDGTPLRKTPWGEIAFQLGGEKAFAVIAEHEKQFIEPKGDVIRAFLPKDRPCLILMDEIINYVSTYRRKGYHNALYNFIQALSETARGQDNVVLVVSIPASELEYTSEDEADEQRFKKMFDRLGKPIMISAEAETSEIIRRRLFEWFGVPKDAQEAIAGYTDWIVDHRQQVPEWFPIDNARDAFAATYPFHPAVLSVFERKWQALPRFQRTRGILRLLALWVSAAYREGFKGAQRDPLIGLGTAPLDDPMFRAALFEQLGEPRLEAAITTDICGKKDSHAIRLDKEAVDTIKKARLHRKIATTIFFESNGGQTRVEATVPEIRLAVAEPDLDIGNIETVLESLTEACYFLTVERTRYHFSLKENLNKRFSDRRASIQPPRINERVRAEIQKVFAAGSDVERVFFPDQSNQIPDRPAIAFVVLSPDFSLQDKKKTLELIETMTREYGTSGRTFKSALVWCVADAPGAIYDEARKVLAWEDIEAEEGDLRLDEGQKRQLAENVKKAQRDLKECVWRTYKNIVLLGKDNQLRHVDLGLVHSSAADSIVTFVLNRLRQDGDVEKEVSPNFLVRNWPPAFKEWSTKSVRDAFFASPQFPRLLNPEVARETIARGVENGLFAYVGKTAAGSYEPFVFSGSLSPTAVELSEDVFIVPREAAEKYQKAREAGTAIPSTTPKEAPAGPLFGSTTSGPAGAAPREGNGASHTTGAASRLTWMGEIPHQKWMNFYTKVLSKFASGKGLKLTLKVEASPAEGISPQKVEETKVALRELGLDSEIETE